MTEPLLQMEGISKSFADVPALIDIRLEVARGQVHALLGENGAGKSTLMKILAGILPRDRGSIRLKGAAVEIGSPEAALRLGISMIHQELNPVRDMTVSENIFLGKEPCYRFTPVVNRRKQRELTRRLLGAMDIAVDPDATMRDLSVAQTQMIEIVKAVSANAEIIIMDEPTSAIADREVARLFQLIQGLKAKGIAIIYISHKLDEIYRISDTITVLRDGRTVASRPAAELDRDELVKLMVGRQISELFPPVNSHPGPVSIEVDGLAKSGVFRDFRFSARQGEVLGFAGLLGAGRTEAMETLFGLRRADAGTVKISGEEVRIRSPAEAIRHGIALVTEDRQLQGLNLKASVRDNITLVRLKSFCRFGRILRRGTENRAADAAIANFGIKSRGRSQPVRTLSGGNQQKVVLAKWLLNDPRIIILDEPTRGIDIGAKAEIYRMIAELAQQGRTILMISSELEEIMGLCHRVIVVHQGTLAGEFERSSFDREKIIKAAMGNDHDTGTGAN